MAIIHIKISAPNTEALRNLPTDYKVSVARHTLEQVPTGYTIHAHANEAQIHALETSGYLVQRLENADTEGKVRQQEVRHTMPEIAAPVGAFPAATGTGYLSPPVVEKAVAAVAAHNPAFVKLINLPNKTWENRVCSAVKIGTGTGKGHSIIPQNRPGIYLLGGIHAREWGSPDILVNFVYRLAEAFRDKTGLQLGSNKFTPDQIQHLVNGKDTYVFPQANPDGRSFSMTQDAMWRKNRRAAPPGSQCLGVDVNRNYDFMWDFPVFFASNAGVANSKMPCDETYIGPAATSEPETKNVVWLLENCPNIRYFVDLHSYSESILYNWGDDEDQVTDPNMNFQNPAYNGKRGLQGDQSYKEYMPTGDHALEIELANTMRTAIQSTRGRTYTVEPSVGLYPTAGTSADYAYSRHFANAHKPKVCAFTIEWGSANNPTPFHPPYGEMRQIIDEITAALLAFCIAAP